MRLLLLFLVYAMILSVALSRYDADANYLAITPRAAERAETTSRRGRRGAASRREKCHAHPRRWDALRAASIERQHGNTNGDTRRSRLCFRAASRSMCRTHGGRHPPAAEWWPAFAHLRDSAFSARKFSANSAHSPFNQRRKLTT